MKKIITVLAFGFLLGGCAGPRYAGSPLDSSVMSVQKEVVVIRDAATRAGFLAAVEEWLKENNYRYTVVPDGSEHELNKITLEYVGHWRWDFALYLSNAEIEAFNGGQKVGRVDYNAPNTLNFSKFGVGAERIKYMLDVLFARMTPSEATAKISGSQGQGQREEVKASEEFY